MCIESLTFSYGVILVLSGVVLRMKGSYPGHTTRWARYRRKTVHRKGVSYTEFSIKEFGVNWVSSLSVSLTDALDLRYRTGQHEGANMR